MTSRNELDYTIIKDKLFLKLEELGKEFSTYYADFLLFEKYDKPITEIRASIRTVRSHLGMTSEALPSMNLMRVIKQTDNINLLKSLSETLIPELISEISSFLKKPLERPNDTSTEPYEKLEALCKESLELLDKIKAPLEERLKGSTVDELALDYNESKRPPSPTSKK